jgi:hypothetical protein
MKVRPVKLASFRIPTYAAAFGFCLAPTLATSPFHGEDRQARMCFKPRSTCSRGRVYGGTSVRRRGIGDNSPVPDLILGSQRYRWMLEPLRKSSGQVAYGSGKKVFREAVL